MTAVEFLESRISVLIPEDIGSQLMYKSNIKKAKAMETVESMRVEKLETLAKLLAKTWFYGDWKWETPNERVMQMLMEELGLYPFELEEDMIRHTEVHSILYKQAAKEIPAHKPDSMDFICTTEDCPHCAEDIRLMKEDDEPFRVWECCGMEDCICEPEDDGLTDDEWVIKELKEERDTPMIIRLREHLSKITPEEFNKEIDEIAKELGVHKEMSDEEIEKAGWDYELSQIGDDYEHHFIEGAKWYREQLKKK